MYLCGNAATDSHDEISSGQFVSFRHLLLSWLGLLTGAFLLVCHDYFVQGRSVWKVAPIEEECPTLSRCPLHNFPYLSRNS